MLSQAPSYVWKDDVRRCVAWLVLLCPPTMKSMNYSLTISCDFFRYIHTNGFKSFPEWWLVEHWMESLGFDPLVVFFFIFIFFWEDRAGLMPYRSSLPSHCSNYKSCDFVLSGSCPKTDLSNERQLWNHLSM